MDRDGRVECSMGKTEGLQLPGEADCLGKRKEAAYFMSSRKVQRGGIFHVVEESAEGAYREDNK